MGGISLKYILKTLRQQKALSQRSLATQVHISQNHYSNIELGRRRPSPDVAKRIATVLGFPDDWYRLLERDHETTVQSTV